MDGMRNHARDFGKSGLLLAIAFASQGCGGSSGGASDGGLVQATTCSGTYKACGGDPTGTWDIASLCAEGDWVGAYNEEMAAQVPACGSAFTSVKPAGSGSVTYAAGNVTFNATTKLAASVTYTPACFSAAYSGLASSASACSQAEAGFNSAPATAGSATCSYAGVNCSCSTTIAKNNTTSGSYTISGSTITESSGDTYDFCVNGNTMTEREQATGSAYAVTTLRRH